MGVNDFSLGAFKQTSTSDRTVLIGFGCSGRLHFGHLPVLWLYDHFTEGDTEGSIFLSDVGSYFSRSLRWGAIQQSRRNISRTLTDFRLETDVRLESSNLPTLLNLTSEFDHLGDIGATLTLTTIRDVATVSDSLLVILGSDESKYVEVIESHLPSSTFSYIVLEDIPGANGETKMSKSNPNSCIPIGEIREQTVSYNKISLTSYFQTISDAVGVRNPVAGADGVEDCISSVRETIVANRASQGSNSTSV